MTTWLEIIDTVVKIGLGASLSGVAAYAVSNKNNKHNLRKELVNSKKELLKECTFKLEKSSSILNHSTLSIIHLKSSSKNPSLEKIEQQLIDLTSSYNEVKEAKAIASLISEEHLVKKISEYQFNMSELISYYRHNLLNYDQDYLRILSKSRKSILQSISIESGKIFESLYK